VVFAIIASVKKVFIILASIIVIALITVSGVYFLFRTEVNKHLIPETQKIIKDTTDLNVSFSDFEFSFANLLKLEPSIVIKDLKIENSLTAKKVIASLYLSELLNKKFKVKTFEINNAVLNLKQKANGEIELSGLNNKTKNPTENSKQEKKATTQSFLEEIELKNFEITNSLINLNLYNVPETIKFNNFNLKLSDFKSDKEERLTTKLNLDSKLFNSSNSSISVNGSLGPIDKDFKTLPINVTEKIKLSIASIPPALLQRNVGELVQISDAYIIEEAKLEGDFLGTSSGSGSLEVNNLEIGQSKETSLTLNSKLPISFKLKNKYTPTLSLSTDNSVIDLKSKDNDSGKLEFDADLAMNLKSGFINGNSSGNITGINVKNLVHALTDLRNLVSGELFLQNYNVSFAGSTPELLFKSAKASANLEIRDGSIYILDTIMKYKDIANEILKGLGSTIKTEKISGRFKTFKSDLKLANKILAVENIDIVASEEQIKISGRGEVRNLQWLVFDLNLDVPKLEPVPLSVRGTIESPKIYPNIKNISKKQSEQMLNSFLEYGLNALKQAAPSKKQSFGSFLKDTLNDNLKDGLLETKPVEPVTP
jgi:hypothetical protein